MKARAGGDAESGIVHLLVSTAANNNDVAQAGELLDADEANPFGDTGYRGADKRKEADGPQWQIAMQAGKCKQLSDSPLGQQILKKADEIKTSIRSTSSIPCCITGRQVIVE